MGRVSSESERLEYTINAFEQLDFDTSPTLARKAISQCENISTALRQDFKKSEYNLNEIHENVEDKNDLLDNEADVLAQMSNFLIQEQGESAGESILLNDLKTLKEEAWVRKRDKKLKKLKKVQFEDQQPLPFHRICCCRRKLNGTNSNWMEKVGESVDNASATNSPGSIINSRKMVKYGNQKVHTPSPNNPLRPVAKLHSIDMYRNIIPSYMFHDISSNYQQRRL